MLKSKIKALLLSSKHKRIRRSYPFVPVKQPENLRGKLEVLANRCIGCGSCVRTCPSRLIKMEDLGNERLLTFSSGRCIYCGRCAAACPEKAIQITNKFELATENKKDLELVIKLKMAECIVCGKPFMVENMLNKLIEKLEKKSEEEIRKLKMCSECKRKLQDKKG